MKILIKNGTLCTMIDGVEDAKGDILVEDGKIVTIGQDIQDKDAAIIDASGLYVLPGMIDAHTHIGMFDFNHECSVDDANEMTNPVTIAMDARYGVKAPCAVKIALGGNPKNTYGDQKQLPMTRMGVAHVLRETFRKGKTYLEKKERGEDVTYDADMEVLSLALKGDIPCKVHCTQYDMLTAIEICKEYGVRFSLEHAWGATDYMDEIVESGCDVCYGPIGTYRCAGERRKIDIEAVKELDNQGVNVALVTDSPILSEESLYHHIGEAVREGVLPERAIRMVTVNAAKSMGVDDRIGTLEVGKDADIILVKGRLGLDTDAKVQYTMIDGKVVYQRGKYKK